MLLLGFCGPKKVARPGQKPRYPACVRVLQEFFFSTPSRSRSLWTLDFVFCPCECEERSSHRIDLRRRRLQASGVALTATKKKKKIPAITIRTTTKGAHSKDVETA